MLSKTVATLTMLSHVYWNTVDSCLPYYFFES